MDMRGIGGVVASDDIEPGLFHLQRNPEGGTWLCLRVALPDGNEPSRSWDIVFDRLDRHGIFFSEPQDVEPVVALPPVSLRINPASLAGSEFSTNFNTPLIAVAGQVAFARAANGGRGGLTFNLATGEVVSPPSGWLAFSEWSLVMDRGDEEIVLFSAGAEGS